MIINENPEIRLGYACINTQLRELGIYTNRTLILRTAIDRGFDYIRKLAKANVRDLFQILIWNEAHGIRFFRISSAIFPHLANQQLPDSNYDLSFVKDELKSIGNFAKQHNHRLTMHPGQFVQLGSPNPDVVARSIVDLTNHAQLLIMMNCKPSDGSVLIVHGGGTYGDKVAALKRWSETYQSIPESVRQYICLENDENGYGIMDLLPFCENHKIPFCLDVFHNRVSKDRIPITKRLLRRIFATWHHLDANPKVHYSEQQVGLRRGAHSKSIIGLPRYLLDVPKMFGISLDITLETKDKEQSVFKMYHKYFNIKMDEKGRVSYVLKQRL